MILSAPGNSCSPILAAENLSVHFPLGRHGETLKAVDGVSFTVARGEIFGLIGESGSGKSTLGRALVCLQRLSGGILRHHERDPFSLSRSALRRHRRSFQMVFQDPHAALNPRQTIGASLHEPLDIAGEGTPATRAARVSSLLDAVELPTSLLNSHPHELSGGQKQRVNIARALALSPALLVCDEIVSALDPSVQAGILNLLIDLQRQFNLSLIFITHDLSVVGHIADRIAVMYLGRLMEFGPAEALMAVPLHPYTAALLDAEPRFTTSKRSRPRALTGEMPSPVAPPSGCRFRSRCPEADAGCAAAPPEWRELAPGHFVACHYAKPRPISAETRGG
jgi:peptide/nickel transport system ATP-binding protein/oligopeptide transport system ATP-binding protein